MSALCFAQLGETLRAKDSDQRIAGQDAQHDEHDDRYAEYRQPAKHQPPQDAAGQLEGLRRCGATRSRRLTAVVGDAPSQPLPPPLPACVRRAIGRLCLSRQGRDPSPSAFERRTTRSRLSPGPILGRRGRGRRIIGSLTSSTTRQDAGFDGGRSRRGEVALDGRRGPDRRAARQTATALVQKQRFREADDYGRAGAQRGRQRNTATGRCRYWIEIGIAASRLASARAASGRG
mgnify:CR=1 FL=1